MFVATSDGDEAPSTATDTMSQTSPGAKVNPAAGIHVSPHIAEVENNPDSTANAAAKPRYASSTNDYLSLTSPNRIDLATTIISCTYSHTLLPFVPL